MSKNTKVYFLVSIVAFLLIPYLSGCGGPAPRSPQRGEGPVRGGVWIDDFYSDPATLIPNAPWNFGSLSMEAALYAPLFYGDAHGGLHPGLATEVPTIDNGGVSPDLKTWTFHLRPHLKWSDGQPITADDVDYTWMLWNNLHFGANVLTAVNAINSTTLSADKLQITFHLKQPFVAFLAYWTDGIYAPLPKHHFASMDPADILKSSDNLNPTVVSGPFQISEARLGDHYTLVRNPNYYQATQGLPYLEKLIIRIIPNQDTILKDLQVSSIDSSFLLDPTKATDYRKLNDYKLLADPNAAEFEALYFNFRNPILGQNREVRQAIAMAVDQQTLIKEARYGLAGPACTEHTQVYTPGYQADAPCPKFDLAAANKLLDDHGWVLGPDGVRTKHGQRLEFQYSTTANNPWREIDELVNQANFMKIGIKVDIQNYTPSTFAYNVVEGKYDIYEGENGGGYDPDDSTLFPCQGSMTYTSYCNSQLDKLYQQELATGDPVARQKVFNAIHQIELTDFPQVVEFTTPDIAISKLVTHNYMPSAVGQGEMINVWEWWCTSGRC